MWKPAAGFQKYLRAATVRTGGNSKTPMHNLKRKRPEVGQAEAIDLIRVSSRVDGPVKGIFLPTSL
jgi:hypothetical protein